MVVTDADPWQALRDELGRWTAPPGLWLRDDDAVGPTPALSALFELGAVHRIPMCAAVIPAALKPGFAAWMTAFSVDVSVVPHGFAHANYAPADAKKAEFGDHRDAATMAAELRLGLEQVMAAFGSAGRAVFVPPWNRIGPGAAAALGAAGYRALSTKAPPGHTPVTGITVMDVDIDIIDWRGTRGYAGDAQVVGSLRERLAALRQQGRMAKPTGILTHHAVHDRAAWTFLDTLFRETATGARWLTVDDVLAANG